MIKYNRIKDLFPNSLIILFGSALYSESPNDVDIAIYDKTKDDIESINECRRENLNMSHNEYGGGNIYMKNRVFDITYYDDKKSFNKFILFNNNKMIFNPSDTLISKVYNNCLQATAKRRA